MRPARIASCLLVVALAAPAGASPLRKPTRSLLADPRGDARLPGDAYDIVCADLAASRQEVVAVLRLAGPPDTPLGVLPGEWRLGVDLAGTGMQFRSQLTATGSRASDVVIGNQSVPHTFAVDAARHTLTWRVSRRAAPALGRPKLSVYSARAETYAWVPADTADTQGVCPS